MKVLIAYADIVKQEFPQHTKDERVVNYILLKHKNMFLRTFTNKINSLIVAGVHTNEQHPAASCPVRKIVRGDGRRKVRGGRS